MQEKTYDSGLLLSLYETMLRIREFESRAADCFAKGLLAGNIHLCLGQEAVAAGACRALEPGDYITSTHRGHGHCIAKGADTGRMMAELFGKAAGYCGGKGGSMHIADVEQLHSLGANGIVGAGIPIATGSALASKLTGDGRVTLCFFGDGASNQGVFHEAVNMAATWKLPVVYLCENNGYAVSTPAEVGVMTNTEDLAVRAGAYAIPGVTVDGCDALAVYEAGAAAAARARAGEGPSLVECKTYRLQGHYCGEPAPYRPKEYLEEAQAHDAIARMGALLLERGLGQEALDRIRESVEQELAEAVRFAQQAPYPEPCEITTDVYASDNERSVAR